MRSFLVPVALLGALAFPAAALAQTPAAPPAAPEQSAPHHGGLMREMMRLNLTTDQQSKITALHTQFQQAHPKGSPRDPQAMKAYHEQLMAVLTPAQQAQFKSDMQAQRQENDAAQGTQGAAPPEHENGMMRRLGALNLTDQQQTQIKNLMVQYRQTHPAGSPRDPAAMQAMRKQIDAMLTPAQLQQLQAMRQDDGNGINP